jgi:plastocyanin
VSDTPSPTRKDPSNVGLVLAVLAVGAAFALSVAAVFIAGSDEGGGTSAGGAPSSAAVSLTEFAISPNPLTVAEGGTLSVTNDGTIEHNLAVRDQDLATADLAAGGSEDLGLSGLAAGSYQVYCTIAGHESSGMVADLTVAAGSGGEAAPAAEGGDSADSGHSTHGADLSEEEAAALDDSMMESFTPFVDAATSGEPLTEGLGGQPLEPTVLEDGTKRFEITAQIVEWEVEPGKVVEAWTYNGTVPAPEIRAEVGDQVEVVLTNDTPLGTDLHMHGIKLPNSMDGVAPLTQELIEPGESFTYSFTAEKPAVAMYHAHVHGQMAVPNGMLGMMYIGEMPIPDIETVREVVADPSVPDDVTIDEEFAMVLNDAGTIGYALNGKSFPATQAYVGDLGDWKMVHYANEGVTVHPMHLHQMDQIVIAKDGIPLAQPYAVDTLNVAPGERYTVIFRLENPGVWVWHCHILPHAEKEDRMFGMVTAVIVNDPNAPAGG